MSSENYKIKTKDIEPISFGSKDEHSITIGKATFAFTWDALLALKEAIDDYLFNKIPDNLK